VIDTDATLIVCLPLMLLAWWVIVMSASSILDHLKGQCPWSELDQNYLGHAAVSLKRIGDMLGKWNEQEGLKKPYDRNAP
jgi:hypothetical protein